MRFVDRLMLLAHKLLGPDGSPEEHNEARLDVVDKRLDEVERRQKVLTAAAARRAQHALQKH